MSVERSSITSETLAWDKQGGLLPAIVQDADTLRVLMLGYMDATALRTTLDSGHVTFFSRSRNAQWTKGETSGHYLDLVAIDVDCDRDTLLVTARPHGPTCHLGRESCFAHAPGGGRPFLHELDVQAGGLAELAAVVALQEEAALVGEHRGLQQQHVGDPARRNLHQKTRSERILSRYSP